MPRKPTSFEDIIGHSTLLEFLKNHLQNGTLPQFIIFEGDEGLGKTSLAKLLAYYLTGQQSQVRDRVILKNLSTEDVLLYNMSVNGGKDTAKEVESNLSLGLSAFKTKCIICDEAHGLSDAAQDVFLVSTEYLPAGVYLFMCTTDTQNLKPTLMSRALTLHLNHLSNKEMILLLQRTVAERALTLQSEAQALNILAGWAEGKPRVAINLLEGFAPGSHVPLNTLKEFIDYMNIDEILPLLTQLSGSITGGLSYIQEMKLNQSIIPLLCEILKVQMGQASFKLTLTDTHKVREQLAEVPVDNLIKFIYLITGQQKITRPLLISAFLQSHMSFKHIMEPPQREDVLRDEMSQKLAAPKQDIQEEGRPAAPTLQDILKKGKVVSNG